MARVSTLKGVLVAAGIAGVGAILSIATPVKAQATLFTTYDDWNEGSAGTATTLVDLDGGTTDGVGNLVSPGAPGTPGAAQFSLGTGRTSIGFGTIDTLPSQGGNNAFLSLIDPGYNTATQATTAYSGDMYLTYTLPAFTTGTYFQLGVLFQYNANSYYGTMFAPAGDEVSDGTIDGLTTVTDTIPYTINAGFTYGFGLGIQSNTDYKGTASFYVDDLAVSVPEPASLSLLGLAGISLLARRRK